MKIGFWGLAVIYMILWTMALWEISPPFVENASELLFWRMIAMIALGYLDGIYETLKRLR